MNKFARIYSSDCPDSNTNRPSSAILLTTSTIIFFACMLIRSPVELLRPRFLAEEGFVYFQYMEHSSFYDSLLFVYRANFQLLTNVICLISVHMPDRYAAVPTTYIAIILDIYCCFLMSEVLSSRGVSLGTTAVAVILFSFQPAGYEVLLNTTNVMWVCSASTLFICLSEDYTASSARAWLSYISLAMFGMTGIPSITLLPFYLVQGIRKKSVYRMMLLSILTCAAIIQASVVLSHKGYPDRAMMLSARSIIPIVMQTELANFLPSEALDELGARIVRYDTVGCIIATQIILLSLGLLIAVYSMAGHAMTRVDGFILIGSMIFVSAFNEFGALGPPEVMHSGWGGSRYFFLGNTCFLALICLGRDFGPVLQRRMIASFMALILSNAILQCCGAEWVAIYTAGPSVSSQVKACAGARPCQISYPPHGPGAEFMLDHTFIPNYQLP